MQTEQFQRNWIRSSESDICQNNISVRGIIKLFKPFWEEDFIEYITAFFTSSFFPTLITIKRLFIYNRAKCSYLELLSNRSIIRFWYPNFRKKKIKKKLIRFSDKQTRRFSKPWKF